MRTGAAAAAFDWALVATTGAGRAGHVNMGFCGVKYLAARSRNVYLYNYQTEASGAGGATSYTRGADS